MRALIFDLDGTLVESLPGIAGSLNRSLTLHGLPQHNHASVRDFIGDGARKLVERALTGMSRLDLTDSLLEAFAKDYAIAWPQGTQVYPGIHELLTRLSSDGVPLAVLSNKPHAFTEEIVGKLFPKNTFAAISGNREGMPHKPDPTGALEIAGTLNLPPEQCTLIGDSVMDLETARNAGMKSIAVTWGYHDKERLCNADRIADSINELATILG
jgi:phosphoglycolate phosphatase